MGRGGDNSAGDLPASSLRFLDPEAVEARYSALLIKGKSIGSAVDSARRRFHYEGERDLLRLAAVLALSISQNHALVDGNKRASVMLCDEFLQMNGLRLKGSDDELSDLFWRVGAMAIGEDELTTQIQFLSAFGSHPLPFDKRYPEVIRRLAQ